MIHGQDAASQGQEAQKRVASNESGESPVDCGGEPDFPCWCAFFNADYICDEHLGRVDERP